MEWLLNDISWNFIMNTQGMISTIVSLQSHANTCCATNELIMAKCTVCTSSFLAGHRRNLHLLRAYSWRFDDPARSQRHKSKHHAALISLPEVGCSVHIGLWATHNDRLAGSFVPCSLVNKNANIILGREQDSLCSTCPFMHIIYLLQ